MKPVDLLSRGRNVEVLDTREHHTPPGCHPQPVPAHLDLDAWRGPARVYQQEPRCRSAWTCKCPSCESCLSHAYFRYQLTGVAEGLCYLHSCNVIHGDLRGVWGCSDYCFAIVLTPDQSNILMDSSGNPRITEFGLAMVARNLDSTQSTQNQRGHAARWAAPEVSKGGKTNSKEIDIFSFAMVMIEVRDGRSVLRRVLAYRHLASM